MTPVRAVFTLPSPEEAVAFGRALGKLLRAGDVVALTGDLGAGKTTITQGIARGLEVDERYYITSPTFTLINEYPGRVTLYHLDLYRLSSGADMEGLGLEEYLEAGGVAVIEWADRLQPGVLPEIAVRLEVTFPDPGTREVVAVPVGEAGAGRLRDWVRDPALSAFLTPSTS